MKPLYDVFALLAVLAVCVRTVTWPSGPADADVTRAGGGLTSALQAPVIEARGDVVLPAGGNASIVCVGSAPLHWDWLHEARGEDKHPNNNVVVGALTVTDNGVYKLSLYLRHAQFFNTAVYYCDYITNDTTTTTTTTSTTTAAPKPFPVVGAGGFPGGFPGVLPGGLPPLPGGGPADPTGGKMEEMSGSRVRVFVSDTENMFLEESTFGIHFVTVFYGHQVALPCAVSDPAFNVTLLRKSDSRDFTNIEGVTFDPVEGFIVASPYYIFSGTFKCVAKGNDTDGNVVQEDLDMALKYIDTELLPPPQLTASADNLLVGQKFSLMCRIDVKPETQVELRMIYEQHNDDRVFLDTATRTRRQKMRDDYDELTRLLTIVNVTEADSGVYGCTVVGVVPCPGCNNTQTTHVNINVYEESFVYLKPSRALLKVNDTAEAVYFFVEINAFPEPQLQWFHDARPLVDSALVLMAHTSRVASLIILGTRSSDSGFYTLRAATPDRNASANITLLVFGKPIVSILPVGSQKGQVVVRAGATQQLHCQVEGIHVGNVTWLFQQVAPGHFRQNASLWESVAPGHWELTTLSASRQDSILHARGTRTGWYRCSARNHNGRDNDDIKFIVSDDEKILTMFDKSLAEPRTGDALRVVCRANRWVYHTLSFHRVYPSTPVPPPAKLNNLDLNMTSVVDKGTTLAAALTAGYRVESVQLGEEESAAFTLEYSWTRYSLEVTAKFPRLADSDVGWYRCQATDFSSVNATQMYRLRLAEDISKASFSTVYIGAIVGGFIISLVFIVAVIVIFARRKSDNVGEEGERGGERDPARDADGYLRMSSASSEDMPMPPRSLNGPNPLTGPPVTSMEEEHLEAGPGPDLHYMNQRDFPPEPGADKGSNMEMQPLLNNSEDNMDSGDRGLSSASTTTSTPPTPTNNGDSGHSCLEVPPDNRLVMEGGAQRGGGEGGGDVPV